ncbi:hypothetical protein D3C86_1829240 [compost metagenome]
MAAVLGFAGVQFDGEALYIKPALPEQWNAVELPLVLLGDSFRLRISRNEITVTAAAGNRKALALIAFGDERQLCRPGARLLLQLAGTASAAE